MAAGKSESMGLVSIRSRTESSGALTQKQK